MRFQEAVGTVGEAVLMAIGASTLGIVAGLAVAHDGTIEQRTFLIVAVLAFFGIGHFIQTRQRYTLKVNRWNGRRYAHCLSVSGYMKDGTAVVEIPAKQPLGEGEYQAYFLYGLEKRDILAKVFQIVGGKERVYVELGKVQHEYRFTVAPGIPASDAKQLTLADFSALLSRDDEFDGGCDSVAEGEADVAAAGEPAKRGHGSRKRTHEEYAALLGEKAPEVELLERYVDSQTSVAVRCRECGRRWKSHPSRLLKEGCRYCREEGLDIEGYAQGKDRA